MPALVPTGHEAEIAWLGRVADREAGLPSAPCEALTFTFAGPEGEAHGGETRPSCSRVVALHPRGTEIRNVRQLSIVSAEDLDAIARSMAIDRLDPAWLGATMVVRGVPDFTHLPPSSRLQGPDGLTLVVDMENRPCHLPAKVIDEARPGAGRAFRSAARGRRGVTAWVERPGTARLGDRLRLFVPDQPAWAPGTPAAG